MLNKHQCFFITTRIKWNRNFFPFDFFSKFTLPHSHFLKTWPRQARRLSWPWQPPVSLHSQEQRHEEPLGEWPTSSGGKTQTRDACLCSRTCRVMVHASLSITSQVHKTNVYCLTLSVWQQYWKWKWCTVAIPTHPPTLQPAANSQVTYIFWQQRSSRLFGG